MGALKRKAKSSKIGRSLGKAGKAIGLKGSGSGKRRHKGPTYWANKVLVEKLKRKYNKLKYGGRV